MAFLKSLLKTFNRFKSGMREKPDVQLDDYILEHFLLYHGLVGSMPENQRDYKDVRTDVIEAVNHNCSQEMAIALKVPPLWWEDRLGKIFDEVITANEAGAIHCLLAAQHVDDIDGDKFPLKHSDWRVRSNAARVLGKLGTMEAIPYMVNALEDASPEQQPAFCHLAYALAKLQTEQSRQALVNHLNHSEPWFRVDAAGALAHWTLHTVAHDLMSALLHDHNLTDYAAVAIARQHSPSALLDMQNDEINEGVAEMVCSLLKGLSGPFHAEVGLAEQLEASAEPLNIAAGVKPTPRLLNATICLNRWLHERAARTNAGSLASTVYTLTSLTLPAHRQCVLESLRKPGHHPRQQNELRHAIELCGSCQIEEAVPLLLPLLVADSPLLPCLLDSLGKLQATEAASAIIALVEQKIDLQSRYSMTASKHPVEENEQADSLMYWSALRALGQMPAAAVNDYAPDKREQALIALAKVCAALAQNGSSDYALELTEILRDKLADPSPQVRAATLKAVGERGSKELLLDSIKLLHSPEVSLQRQCLETMCALATAGHKDDVVSAAKSALLRELDGARRERLQRLLRAL